MADEESSMLPTAPSDEIHATLSTVFREEAGRLVGALLRLLGNFEVAEEIVQDALLFALERWPVEGIPAQPGAWLMTVARRRAIDQLRRDAHYRDKLAELEQSVVQEPDDRLRLMFTCCHPALTRETQVVLTLRAVCGFTTAEIAHAFLVSESAVARRLVRARQKIVQAGIPYRVPRAEELDERLGEVLAVLYLMFNEGYMTSGGSAAVRRDLAEDAAWLAAFVARLYPREPEALGLLALMRLHLARAQARFDARGKLILLPDQDRSRWDRGMIREAGALIEQAAALGHPGPYQVQAALVACHAEAESWQTTDWPQILALYDLLLSMAPSPVVRLNRAVALRSIDGLSVVALRSCFHMTNFLRTIRLIKQAGINAGAVHADLPMPMIAARDLAAVAAEYLMAPSFSGYQVRDLLGACEYTHREATSILGAAIGRPDLPYIELSYEQYRQNLLEMGMSESAAETLVQTWRAVNEGPGNTYPPRNASNTTPTTLEEFARDTFVHAYQAS